MYALLIFVGFPTCLFFLQVVCCIWLVLPPFVIIWQPFCQRSYPLLAFLLQKGFRASGGSPGYMSLLLVKSASYNHLQKRNRPIFFTTKIIPDTNFGDTGAAFEHVCCKKQHTGITKAQRISAAPDMVTLRNSAEKWTATGASRRRRRTGFLSYSLFEAS